MNSINWKDKARASSIHLLICIAIASILAFLLFFLWYPYPYREISGGRDLFLIIIFVDVVIGPLITLVVFDKRKPLRELRTDLIIVGTLQLFALFYGGWTVYNARPIYLVFEYQRFSVVHATDIDQETLKQAPEQFRALPLKGPLLLSLRPLNKSEVIDSALLAMNGVPQAAQPQLWQEYVLAKDEILQSAKSLDELKDRFPASTTVIEKAINETGLPAGQLSYLPLLSRKKTWTAILDNRTAMPVGFFAFDPF